VNEADAAGDQSGEVDEEGFCGITGGEGEGASVFGGDGVACGQGGAVDVEGAFDELEPDAAAGADGVGGGSGGLEADAIDCGVLVDGGRAIAAVRGDDEDDGGVIVFRLGMPLGVRGGETAFARENPDLEEMEEIGGRGVELAVGDAAAGAHELDLAGAEFAAVAHAVLVGDGTGDDAGEDFHVAVRVGGEAGAGGDAVFVDDAERAEAHVGGVVVVAEAEGMEGAEPAVVGVAAVGGFAKGEFHGEGRMGAVWEMRQCRLLLKFMLWGNEGGGADGWRRGRRRVRCGGQVALVGAWSHPA
jgi:hypothetical protein